MLALVWKVPHPLMANIGMPTTSQKLQLRSHEGDCSSALKGQDAVQSRIRPALLRHQSNPNLRTLHASNRLQKFASIKELARRTSRATLSTARARFSIDSDKDITKPAAAVKHYLDCTPPAQTKPLQSKPDELTSSSLESSFFDRSGYSTTLSSIPTTPVGKEQSQILADSHKALTQFPDTKQTMGQKSSTTIIRKTNASRTGSLDAFSTSPPPSPDLPVKSSPEKRSPPPTFTHRPNTIQVAVPRRRSSLTVIHAGNSPLNASTGNQHVIKHHSSSSSNIFQQDIGSQSTITSLDMTRKQENISPPLRSHQTSAHQPSPHSRHTSSQDGAAQIRIRFPKTFPDGPIEIPKPMLNKSHFNCYIQHRRTQRSNNKICPVPCMTCGRSDGDIYWKCVWCCLRVCGECMAEFSARGRNLDVLLGWIQRRSRSSLNRNAVLRQE